MNLVTSRSICKKEFGSEEIPSNILEMVLKKYKKGIPRQIKGKNLPANTRLEKLYVTSKDGDMRMVFLAHVQNDQVVLLLCRRKNDQIARNITVDNPKFKNLLEAYLALLEDDIENNNFDVHSIS